MFNLRPVRARSFSFLFLAALSIVVSSARAQFNPLRTFPDTTNTIGVFVDELPGGMTAAQNRFAATHYAGTQKLTTNWIDPIRVYNPNFLMLQYRLGDRDSGDATTWIHNNTWSSDWTQVNAHENWFVHINGNNTSSGRLYQGYGSVKEWIMDVAGLINGVPMASSYGAFWTSETIADNTASHADGTFADGDVLPWAPSSSNSPIGGAPCTAYIPSLNAFYQYVYQQYTAANMYFIPNVGALTTNADTSTCYYNYVHGDFMEGFGVKTSDWTEEKNRTLQFLNNGKIWIAQNYLSSNSDVATREWYLTNYLLLKSNRSYINVPSTDTQLYWWPEYNLALGSPTDALPTNISSYAVGSGIYRRHYQNGIVLVNASGSAATYTFAANDPRYLVAFSGGGDVDASGNVPAGSVTCTLQTGGTFTIPAWSGEVFTFISLPVSAALSVTPTTGLTSAGYMGGPFSPSSASYTLNNTGGQPLNWTAAKTQGWLTLSKTSGTLLVGGTDTVTASIGSGANSLAAGSYSDTVTFTNTTDSTGNTTRPVNLTAKIVGNVNGDGSVDVVDLLYLVDAFGSVPGDPNWNPTCDFNSDSSVDVVDLLDMVSNFGLSVP